MGSHSQFADGVPSEMIDAFQEQIRAFEEKASGGETVSIRSLLGEVELKSPPDLQDPEEAQMENERLLQLVERAGVMVDAIPPIDPIPLYYLLYEVLLSQEVVPPADGQRIVIPFEMLVHSLGDPIEVATENCLLAILDLTVPFPPDGLAGEMRLGRQLVPRKRVMEYIEKWRAQFSGIVPMSFGLLEDQPGEGPSDQQAVLFFGVNYEVTHADGSQETFDGPGVSEFLLVDEEWLLTGLMFPGFEL